jgi:hypothetical protein
MNELAAQEAVSNVLEIAKAVTINTNDDYRNADLMCKAQLDLKKKIQRDFADSKEKAYDAWKAVVAQEKGHLDGLDEARGIIKNKMDAWSREQDRLREIEQRKLEAQAKKLAEDQALAEAKLAEDSGDKEAAEQIISAPLDVAPVYIPKSTPKATTVIRRVPDREKIAQALARSNWSLKIPGVRAFQVWQYEIENAQAVPLEYKKVA